MKKKQAKSETVSITGSVFTGVHWDAKATEAVVITATALLNLTQLFKSQNINIESLLTVNTPKEIK